MIWERVCLTALSQCSSVLAQAIFFHEEKVTNAVAQLYNSKRLYILISGQHIENQNAFHFPFLVWVIVSQVQWHSCELIPQKKKKLAQNISCVCVCVSVGPPDIGSLHRHSLIFPYNKTIAGKSLSSEQTKNPHTIEQIST